MSEDGRSHAVGVVADDLTGAMDTAHGFAVRGHDTTVLATLPGDGPVDVEADALSVNTDSRYDGAQEAAAAVTDAVERVAARCVYKKVDSTLRGNVGAEVTAALDATDAGVALVAPAFPSAGRTTVDGVHYVAGTPVAETEYGRDEKGPASSEIRDLFVDRPVVSLTLDTVEAGRDAVVDAVADAMAASETAPVVVCDARTDEHLVTIAAAGATRDALYVGSGGLAEHLVLDGVATRPPSTPRPASGAPLGVVGSVSETTLTQLERVPAEAVVAVDPVALLDGDGDAAAVERAAARLAAGDPVVLTTATRHATVEETLAAGRERGLSAADIRERVSNGLAGAARRVHDRASPSGVFVTGGDVALAVFEVFDATAVSLSGTGVEAGIPVGTFADGVAAGIPVITKAGGFGSPEAIVTCLDALTPENE
ncbi:four-carbon acid sugar kinase family protein [Halarchaeum sp. P4]|uniref:four-carbon acid sugar kinase family protein n=1 Tax=Halarchaeum sp. P4 TaxID=3421639 RepID=UPI003EBCA86E